jgi:hypothetical protein
LIERVSGSARAAGLGVLIYANNSNFVFWSAQYAYESLSLPLLVALLYLVALRRGPARTWLIPALVLVPAIAMTHHLTSYAMAISLAAIAVVELIRRRRAAWPIALLAGYAVAVTATWLVLVAETTRTYIEPVVTRAVEATLDVVGGADDESSGRALFESTAGVVTPWRSG